MRRLSLVLPLFLAMTCAVFGQGTKSTPPAQRLDGNPPGAGSGADVALERTLAASGSDRSALVRNLQQYLLQYPDAPRKASVYRALVEACEQLQDDSCALNYSERLIAIQPDDSDMMLVAVDYLQRKGDDASLTRASGYVTRVLDRVEKATPDQRLPRESVADWQTRQEHLRGVLYYLLGQVENSRHNYDAAVKDLETSYSIRPTAAAAALLGSIAELRNDPKMAIEEYTLAFVLPDTGPGAKPDRREIREKLGNVWRAVHGSDQGLGDAILATYDHVALPASTSANQNQGDDSKDVFARVVRRLDGTPMSLSTLRGKAIVLNFWTTWCGPCVELQPKFDEVAKAWASEGYVSFLQVNTDENEARVPAFVEHEKWDIPTVYADGLDHFLKVRVLPTVLVLDPKGKVVYRVEGPALPGFATALSAAIQNALGTGR